MSTNALASLQALATKQYKPRNVSKLAQKIEVIRERPTPKLIEIDTDRNEIKVIFHFQPEEKLTNELFRHGFKWQIGSNIYVNDYTNEVIEYLNREWNQSIDFIPSDNLPLGMTIEHLSNDAIEVTPVPAPLPEPSDRFEQYKRQIRDLCEVLKVDQADLALLAISKLHDQTFN